MRRLPQQMREHVAAQAREAAHDCIGQGHAMEVSGYRDDELYGSVDDARREKDRGSGCLRNRRCKGQDRSPAHSNPDFP